MSETQPEQADADATQPEGPAIKADAPWHYATPAGGSVGPLTTEALAEAVASGGIAPDTAVWRAEYGDKWRAARTIPELLPAWIAAEAARVASAERDTVLVVAPPSRAFAEALGIVSSALFHPFSILAWLSLALCRLMASSRMVAGSGGGATPPAISADADPAAILPPLLDYLRQSVASIFTPRVSFGWIATIVLYGLFTSYIAAKGRLMLVGKAYFPREPLHQLWRRAIGRTASLWRLYFSLDATLNLLFYWLVFRFLAAANLVGPAAPDASGLVDAFGAALSSPAAIWLTAATLLVAAIELVRALAFHFAEPLVFLLGVPVGAASRMVRRAMRDTPGAAGRLVGFFAIILVCRAAYFALVLCAALILPSAMLLPVAVAALLPLDFLVRVFGTRFIVVKCPSPSQ